MEERMVINLAGAMIVLVYKQFLRTNIKEKYVNSQVEFKFWAWKRRIQVTWRNCAMGHSTGIAAV